MHRAAAVFLGLYVVAVVYLSLFPGEFLDHPRGGGLLWHAISGRRPVLDAVLNTLFYMPLGFSAVFALPLRRSAWRWVAAVLLGAALSYAIEAAQLYSPQRYASWVDFVANTSGTALGATLAGCLPWKRLGSPARWKLSSDGAVLLIFWLLWQTFPMVPATNLVRFSMAWDRLTQPEWPRLEMLPVGIGFFVLAWVIGRSLWLAVAFGALIAQGFLVERELSRGALVAAGVAWAAASRLPRPKPAWVAWGLTAWLIFEEFRPFQTGADNGFAWAPFGSWYAVAGLSYYPIIFGKLFLYTSVLWWHRTAGRGWAMAIALPAVVLAVGEWAQQYLPGRTPESTDLAVLAAGAVLLALAEKRPGETS